METNTLTFETPLSEYSVIRSVTIEYAQDATIDQLMEVFKAMALCMGYAPKTIEDYFEPNKEDINAEST